MLEDVDDRLIIHARSESRDGKRDRQVVNLSWRVAEIPDRQRPDDGPLLDCVLHQQSEHGRRRGLGSRGRGVGAGWRIEDLISSGVTSAIGACGKCSCSALG